LPRPMGARSRSDGRRPARRWCPSPAPRAERDRGDRGGRIGSDPGQLPKLGFGVRKPPRAATWRAQAMRFRARA
jgi:hypothetical protein